MKRLKNLLMLFLQFFKIGLLTFGGGYAMISIFEDEFVEKNKYITYDEFMELITIAESTPGPIAINGASYIGYKKFGILGSVIATLGIVLPSFIIIYIISLFLNEFMQFYLVQKAFNGIKCAVGVIIVLAGIKLYKKLEKSLFNIICLVVTTIFMIVVDLFLLNFSAIYVILIGGALGIIRYVIKSSNKKESK